MSSPTPPNAPIHRAQFEHSEQSVQSVQSEPFAFSRSPASTAQSTIVFVGGGNMASAILGGLIKSGHEPQSLHVIEPLVSQRQQLQTLGVHTWDQPGEFLAMADLVVWAVKPQVFKEAARAAAPWTPLTLHLSVAAGITMHSMSEWLKAPRLVRAMPNTPALVGLGQTGLYANSAVSRQDQALVEAVLQSTGQWLWLKDESLLDAVTAISGSGPAYVFYFLEAMCAAGEQMGLSAAEAKQLAIGTLIGAGHLASQSPETPGVLRERVTSKGGTTQAALELMNQEALGDKFQAALWAAHRRAKALGEEFGH